jgi:hypothetical protein
MKPHTSGVCIAAPAVDLGQRTRLRSSAVNHGLINWAEPAVPSAPADQGRLRCTVQWASVEADVPGQDPTTQRLSCESIPASRQTRLGVSLPGEGRLAVMLPSGGDGIIGVTKELAATTWGLTRWQ